MPTLQRPDPTEKRLAVWRVLRAGTKVRFRGKNYMKGAIAKVIARLDERLDGYSRYEIEFTDGRRWDVVRWELTPAPKRKR